jgi:adenosylcobyric acid synthase
MSRKEREHIIGFLINKFRGDPELFSDGIAYIEKKTGKPVLGLVPFYRDILIDSEDSVAVQEDKRALKEINEKHVNIAILRLPTISNFTDLEILEIEKDVVVNYLSRPEELSEQYDLLIIPGTKNVIQDALWLVRTGWRKVIRNFIKHGKRILGICGGYQLLGEVIEDPYGVESERERADALGLLPLRTRIEREKIVRRVSGYCLINNKQVKGYEIHMGRSIAKENIGEPFLKIKELGKKGTWTDGLFINKGQVAGTYVHGLLDSPGFRADMLNRIREEKGITVRAANRGRLARFHQYERLADHFEKYCDVEAILSKLKLN